MSVRTSPFALLLVFAAYVPCPAAEPTGKELLDTVAKTYAEMSSFQSEGKVDSTIDTGITKIKQTVKFNVNLEKPNRFKVSWATSNSPLTQSGTVWNDGNHPYLYMSVMKAYAKMESNELALAAATGISSGAAFTIPSLFLPTFKDQTNPFDRLSAPLVEGTEEIEGDECFIVSSPSQISKKESYWISKKTYLIRQFSRSLESPEGGPKIPELSEEDLEAALKSLGQEVNEETKAKMRANMEKSRSMMRKANLKGTITERHTKIQTGKLSKEDLEFTPPEGTVEKDNLFGSAFGAN